MKEINVLPKIIVYQFENYECARQVQKGVWGTHKSEGVTSSDEHGNPSPILPVIDKTSGLLLANIELVQIEDKSGQTFRQDAGQIVIKFEEGASKFDRDIIDLEVAALSVKWAKKKPYKKFVNGQEVEVKLDESTPTEVNGPHASSARRGGYAIDPKLGNPEGRWK